MFTKDYAVVDNIRELNVDLDGSPRAYTDNPDLFPKALDYYGYGYSGDHWSSNVVAFEDKYSYITKDGKTIKKKTGSGVYLQPTGPYAGMPIAKTSLHLNNNSDTDPAKWVDSEKIAYFVMSAHNPYGMRLSDLAYVEDLESQSCCFAVYADRGKHGNCHEGSLKLLRNFRYRINPYNPFAKEDQYKWNLVALQGKFRFILFPGSGRGQGHGLTQDIINVDGQVLFDMRIKYGGDKAKQLYKTTILYKGNQYLVR